MSYISDVVEQMVNATPEVQDSGYAPQSDFVGELVSQMIETPASEESQNRFLIGSGVLDRPIINPRTHVMYNPPQLESLKAKIWEQAKDLSVESAKEALKAEFFLLPSLIGRGLEEARKLPGAGLIAPLVYADNALSALAEDFHVESVPKAGMESYHRTYERMTDLEAELALSMETLSGSKEARDSVIMSAALGNTSMNILVGLTNPAGWVAHGFAAGLKLTSRGLLALGSAYAGRKGIMKLMGRAAESPKVAAKVGKIVETAAEIGRIPPTEGIDNALKVASQISRSKAEAVAERGHRTVHDLTMELMNDFTRAKEAQGRMFVQQERRKAAGLPHPAGVPVIPPGDPLKTGMLPEVHGLSPKGVRAMEEAARRDYRLKQELGIAQFNALPIQRTNVYQEARNQLEILGGDTSLLGRLGKLDEAATKKSKAAVFEKEVDLTPFLRDTSVDRVLQTSPPVGTKLATPGAPLFEYPKGGPIAYREVQRADGTVERIPIAKLYRNKQGKLVVRSPKKKDVQNSFALADDAKRYMDEVYKNADDAEKIADKLDKVGKALGGETGDELRRAASGARRTVDAMRRDPGAPASLVRPASAGIPDIVDPAKHGEQIAGRFIHHRQMALIDAANATQHLIEEVPDKVVRQDLWALLEESGNPFRADDPDFLDTLDDVRARLAAHPDAEKIFALSEKLRRLMDVFYSEANELRIALGDSELSYVENYVQHLWQEPIDQVRAKFARLPRFQLTPEGKFEKTRKIATYMDGMKEAKLTPRTDDPAEMFYLAQQEYARVMATKKMVRDMIETAVDDNGQLLLQRIPTAQAVPEGFVEFRSPFTNRILPDVVEGKSKLVMQKDMFNQLKNVIKTPLEPVMLHKISAVAKRANFFYTFFHMYSLAESGMALLPSFTGKNAGQALMNGLVRPSATVGEIAGRALFSGKAQWKAGEALAHLVSTPTMREATELASFYGVRFGPPPIDVAKSQGDKIIHDFVTRVEAKHKKIGKVLSKAENLMVKKLQGWFDERLWERFHTPMKVVAFDTVFHQLKGIRDGVTKGVLPTGITRRMLKDISDDELGRRVASFINDEFGGQNWEQHVDGFMGWVSDPDVLRNLNSVFLSVDWNVSSIRAGTAFVQAIPGTGVNDPVRGILGVRHWRNAAMGWLMYANTVNKVMSGHGIADNEPGKRMFHIDTGERTEDGRPIYLHIGKQFRELGTLAALGTGEGRPIADFLARKTMPWIRVGFAQANPYGELAAMEREFIKEGRELGWIDRLTFTAKEFVGGFTPIAAQNALGNRAFRHLSPAKKVVSTIGFPASLGPSDTALVAALSEAMRTGNADEVEKLQTQIGENRGPQEAARIIDQARRKVRANPEETSPVEGQKRSLRSLLN